MNDAVRMGMSQGPGNLLDDAGHFVIGERTLPPDPLAGGLAIDVPHHEEDEVLPFLDGVDGDDVGMRKPGGGAGLAEKPGPKVGTHRQGRGEQLDGHQAVEGDLAGEKHHAHAPTAQLTINGISAGHGRLKGEEFGSYFPAP